MMILECIARSELLLGPEKYNLSKAMTVRHEIVLRRVGIYGTDLIPCCKMWPTHGIGILKTMFAVNGAIDHDPCNPFGLVFRASAWLAKSRQDIVKQD